MKAKQISIVIEQTRQTQAKNTPSGGITSEEIEPYYTIIQMRNAATIEHSRNLVLRIGVVLSEEQADEIARCRMYDVTIKS